MNHIFGKYILQKAVREHTLGQFGGTHLFQSG